MANHQVGPVKVKGHGLPASVVTRWRRFWRQTQADIRALRQDLATSGYEPDTYSERLFKSFGNTSIEESLLCAHFQGLMQRTESLQAANAPPDAWLPLLNASLKVAATLKGTRFHNLVTLREIIRLTRPSAPTEREVSLSEYLKGTSEDVEAATATPSRAGQKRTAPAVEVTASATPAA